MPPHDEALAARLSRACPDWSLQIDDEGYVLTPPDGDEALIGTQAALEDWLSRQERWSGERAADDAEPVIEQLTMELAV